MAAKELETTNEIIEEEVKDDELDVEVVDSLTDEDVDTKTGELVEEKTDEPVEEKIDELVEEKTGELTVEETLSELVDVKETAFDDLHVKRMAELGIENPESIDSKSFLCVGTKSMVDIPCDACRGGCAPEGNLPGILDIEVMAKSDYEGEIVRSGYAPAEAIFFVDIKREDGKFIEAAYGGDGEALGWNLLDSGIVAEKGDKSQKTIIAMAEAEEIAVKELGGSVVSVEAAMFEGYDTYVVEIDTVTGKSYDAYVTLDGDIAGWDEYDLNAPEEKAGMPPTAAPAPAASAAPAAPQQPTEDDTAKLVSMIETVTDPAKLKAVIDAIGKDVNSVPAALKAVIVKKANELKVPNILPSVWTQAPKPTVGNAAAAPKPVAPVAPAAPKPPLPEKSAEVIVDGEADDDFAQSMAEFKAMTETDSSEESK